MPSTPSSSTEPIQHKKLPFRRTAITALYDDNAVRVRPRDMTTQQVTTKLLDLLEHGVQLPIIAHQFRYASVTHLHNGLRDSYPDLFEHPEVQRAFRLHNKSYNEWNDMMRYSANRKGKVY